MTPEDPTNDPTDHATGDATGETHGATADLANHDDPVIAATREWVERAVIGLALCPFAHVPYREGRIRFVHARVTTQAALADVVADELERLSQSPRDEIETTLIVHPEVLVDFLDYNDFLDVADAIVAEMELEGMIQVASFHPQYQFEDTAPDDITNYTNRSPYPTLHLLREESVDEAVAMHPDTESIPTRNIETMGRLGVDGWLAIFSASRPRRE